MYGFIFPLTTLAMGILVNGNQAITLLCKPGWVYKIVIGGSYNKLEDKLFKLLHVNPITLSWQHEQGMGFPFDDR